jgi:hypothetical protein
MKDDLGYRILLDELNFENWGICLDTGHLMNGLGNCREEEQSINDVLKIVRSYPQELRGRVDLVHLHMSLSADYQKECAEHPINFASSKDEDMITNAYEHVCKIDQHRPFTNRLCTEIIKTLMPSYVTHEISAPKPAERLSGFFGQRSLFLRSLLHRQEGQ